MVRLIDRGMIFNKVGTIERCLERARDVYDGNPDNLKDNTKQDSIIMNIQRALVAVQDISMHIVVTQKLGIPQNSRDAIEALEEVGIIDGDMLKKLKAMIGFRNIAVHSYQKLNMEILRGVIENNLCDFEEFTDRIMKYIRR
ncbi:type VII toxin-antitoxin system HepT family RNase toxin [Andreesenia angusta]|uniref:type VII toxin-antitoxin system HepT family RNase toxin n=1 Tax=Andreesenia angusta TaxID=39480 RepID=UPI001B8042E1|nr:DUF86 domain-containing protein [Andreesenia angusta]